MLTITIPGDELYNEETNTFETVNDVVLDLEHSLISLSKWESKYQKPFLSSEKKTGSEIFGYIQAMIITPSLDPDVITRCTVKEIEKIQAYIDSSQSATTFGDLPDRRGPSEVVTSELIYFWMVTFNIPFECQSWHLNRLFSLIRICNIKNNKPEKLSRNEQALRNQEINARRRAELGTTG